MMANESAYQAFQRFFSSVPMDEGLSETVEIDRRQFLACLDLIKEAQGVGMVDAWDTMNVVLNELIRGIKTDSALIWPSEEGE